jgi:hypothetical protein
LFLLLGSFYAARKGKWWLAGILGAFCTATRFIGIFLLPALLWEWWEQNQIKNKKEIMKNLLNLVPIFLISSGLVLYMRFLAINYQDPLMFIHAQPSFGTQRVVDKFIPIYQVFWRYLKMIGDTKGDPLFFTVWLELITAVGFLFLIFLAYIKKIRFSYLIFAVFSYLFPALTGTFLSMPRFVLVLFPCFIALGLLKNKMLTYFYVIVSAFILMMATIFFTKGHFVG